ncbi:MAG: hypothetical protein ACEQSA_02215 [Weeksellaceae bacterium]
MVDFMDQVPGSKQNFHDTSAVPSNEILTDTQRLDYERSAYELRSFLDTLEPFERAALEQFDGLSRDWLTLTYLGLKPVMSTEGVGFTASRLAQEDSRFIYIPRGPYLVNLEAALQVMSENQEHFDDVDWPTATSSQPHPVTGDVPLGKVYLQGYLDKLKDWSKSANDRKIRIKAGLLYGFPIGAVLDYADDISPLETHTNHHVNFGYSQRSTVEVAEYDKKLDAVFGLVDPIISSAFESEK